MPKRVELLKVERISMEVEDRKEERKEVSANNRKQITLLAVNSINYSLIFCWIVPSYPIPPLLTHITPTLTFLMLYHPVTTLKYKKNLKTICVKLKKICTDAMRK
jgi:hypothetical protein